MKPFTLFCILLGMFVAPLGAATGSPDFNGRWRLDAAQSTALDGWTAMDVSLTPAGDEVAIQFDMRWRSTSRVSATNTVNTTAKVELPAFFRVEQRHMAVYPVKNA